MTPAARPGSRASRGAGPRRRARRRPVRRRSAAASRPSAQAAPSPARRRSATPSCSTSSSPTDIDSQGNPIGQSDTLPGRHEGRSSACSAGPTSRPARSCACACSRATGSSTRTPHVVVNEAGPRRRRPTSASSSRSTPSPASRPATTTSRWTTTASRTRSSRSPSATAPPSTRSSVREPRSGPDPVQEPVRGPGGDPGVGAPRTLGSRYDAGRGRRARGWATSTTSRQTGRRAPRRTSWPTRSSVCCAAKPYKYLLILGNDDAVPYFRVENPLADSEAAALADWELPHDWVATDNFYTDLDADHYGVPDLPIARIPSSRRRGPAAHAAGREPAAGRRRASRWSTSSGKGQAGARPQHGRGARPGPPPVRAAARRPSSSAPTRTPRTPATCTCCSTGSA